MLITKETGFLGINREIGTVPVGREYCKNIYLTQEENKTVLIFEGNKDYSARMVIQ